MVSYSSASNAQYNSTSSASYSASGNIYTINVKSVCCGSFSRGQRCMGCPGE